MKQIPITVKSAHLILKAQGYRVKDMPLSCDMREYKDYRLYIARGISLVRARNKFAPTRFYACITDPNTERRCKNERQVLELLSRAGKSRGGNSSVPAVDVALC
jgi:hypothetical protein